MPLKIYIASKISHGEKLFKWSTTHNMQIHTFTSNWYRPPFKGMSEDPGFAKMFWEMDIYDVKLCDILLLYAEPEDNLRGALVEVGVALSDKKAVLIVGENDGHGTWQHHRGVFKVKDLEEAERFLAGFRYIQWQE